MITEAAIVRDILIHLGAPITPPTIALARGPPLWAMPQAGQRETDPQAQPASDYEFDQRIAWLCRRKTANAGQGPFVPWAPRSGQLRPSRRAGQ